MSLKEMQQPQKQFSKSLKDISINGLSIVATKLKIFILTPIIVRFVGIEALGAWAVGIFMAQLLSSVGICGMRDSLVRYYYEYKQKNRQGELLIQALTPAFVLCLPITIFTFVWSDKLSELLLHTHKYSTLFRWSSILVIVFSFYHLLLNFIRAQDRIQLYSWIMTFFGLIELIATITILLVKKDVVALIKIHLLTYILSIVVLICLIIPDIPTFKLRWSGIGKLFKYGLPLVPAHLSVDASARGDRLLLGYFMGAYAVGIYSTLYVAANAIALFSIPLVMSLLPKLSRLWDKGEHIKVYDIVCTSTRWLIAISLAALIGLQSIGSDGIMIITREMPESSNWVLLFVGIGAVMMSITRTINLIQNVNKKTKVIGSLWVGAALINLIANIILIPKIGILGAAFSTLFSYLFLFLMSAGLVFKEIKMLFNLSFFVKLMISLSIMWLTINIHSVTSWQNLMITIVLGSVVFICSFLLLNPFITEKEKRIFEDIRNRFLSFKKA
jgi:O-antigen/teichoic acid export membrane protein